ncbi:MAG: helix-turn-helix transcriptional regulator [Clostridia bacterium]|nr:helix-turn-helix transcriptional regulator [Clostridia bacterium]
MLTYGGGAILNQGRQRKNIKTGDVFFIFPAVSYTLEGDDEFEFMYISFVGTRANALMERYGISSRNFVFSEENNLLDLWKRGLSLSNSVTEIVAESLVLYTLAIVRNEFLTDEENDMAKAQDRFLLVKKYIDENFSDPELSLEKLSGEFSYNKKYLSSAFKKLFRVSLSDYLCTVRINHACVLIDRNYKSISDIAFLCGFSDPMHFSKVFKKKMTMSPREYIKSRNV